MTFLRKHGYSSISLTLLIAAIIFQLNPLLDIFWRGIFQKNTFPNASIGVGTLLQADFASAAVLITFGVLIGKVSPTQMLLIAMIEPIFYNLNNQIAQLWIIR